MILTPWQGVVAEDRHRFRVCCVGRRAGKTTLAVEEMKGKAIYTKANIAYVAPTYQQARDIVWETLKKELQGATLSVNESRLEIKIKNIKNSESMITLKGWESIESLRGQSFDMLVIDEVAMMRNFWTSWQEVIRPTLTDRKGDVMFISTPRGFNHFYELYNTEFTDKDYKSFHFTTYDNPHLSKDEIEKAKAEITETRFAQEYLADFKKVEGLVYKEFDRTRHLYTDLPKDIHFEFIGGVDFGYNNPAAVAHIYKTPAGVYYVENEWYQRSRTEMQIADYVASCRFNKVYADPENPSAIQVLSSKNVNVREVIKGKNSVKNGIDRVKDLFKGNKLFINKRCVNMIAELESYCYIDSKDSPTESENPIKENDHLCFTKDTKIEVPYGKILKQVSMGKKDIYKFMGSKVTSNHPYLTQRGFVRLDSIRYSDKVVIWKNKLLMALSLEDIQTPKIVPIGCILHLLQRSLLATKQNVCTGIYGKNSMVKYLRGGIYIIKMEMRLIIIYLISNLFHLKNTIKDITRKIYRFGKKILKKPEFLHLSGMALQKGFIFIGNWGSCHGKTKDGIQNFVKSVINLTVLPFRKDQNSARIIAKLKYLGKEEVYSTATSSGFFVANGIIVSNCDAIRYPIFMEHLIYRKIAQDKPRPIFEDSRYGGKIPVTSLSTDDDITEAELAKM